MPSGSAEPARFNEVDLCVPKAKLLAQNKYAPPAVPKSNEFMIGTPKSFCSIKQMVEGADMDWFNMKDENFNPMERPEPGEDEHVPDDESTMKVVRDIANDIDR